MHKNWAVFPKTISAIVVTAALSACATNIGMTNQAPAPAIVTSAPPLPTLPLPEQPSTAKVPGSSNTCISNVAFPNFPQRYQERMQEIACHLQAQDGLPASYVIPTLQSASFNARAVALMTPPPASAIPATPYPWWRYRDRFLRQSRLNQGVKFWQEHAALLHAVSRKYGVPGSILMGILNIETGFGSFQGGFSVLNSNLSLALALPGRRRFFLHQTAETLKLAQRLGVPPGTLQGSQAGAMGMSQFLASSYLRYAVTWNDPPGGPMPNLWQSSADVLASTANFFRGHGWQSGQPVLGQVSGDQSAVVTPFLQGKHPLAQLCAAGIQPETASRLPGSTPVGLLRLQTERGPTLFIAYPNFYAIMGYNSSTYYSATVWAYAEAIKRVING
ncbi:putative Membrane-bound lytic murein transglycosylase B [Acidithiobacillus ferrivorans]|uniref:Membrane-bound lytic murein transglycosylase B n=1 Tax=Acidithiobacillus ferrivorans TaxID=160808 RepID=A0A060UVM5_9PROT|nr:lytic murein transglycosylase [Acidithiobacillus ferrivorans]CDQ12435.1 putative Membrane-bound lytic murein transglycosylase B [Acidithiobacillus ferrivorans]SMH65021.1 putative Membrane-bound lytic murein transglycosylase B [Acidithiobacillus ferrivorans]